MSPRTSDPCQRLKNKETKFRSQALLTPLKLPKINSLHSLKLRRIRNSGRGHRRKGLGKLDEK